MSDQKVVRAKRVGQADETAPVDMVIIGASGGIGQSLIGAFRGRHRIIGTYCSNRPGERHPDVDYVQLDLRDRSAIKVFCSEIAGKLERPVLIYTPGVSLNNLTHKYTDEDWDQTLDVNLTGAFHICRELLPRMREIGFGRIILLSSVLCRTAVPGSVAYSVTKAGLGALARVIAAENAKKGITANALALGYYNVGIISAVPRPFLEREVIPRIPIGRLGNPSNIHAAVEFLIGADYVTGATLDMNGGIVGS